MLNYKIGIGTLGCKVNQYESSAIGEAFEKMQYQVCDFSERCDVYIINTCTVTAESDRKARQMIRRALHQNPNAYLLVTGCYSQTQPEAVAKMKGVDFICGNHNKMEVVAKTIELLASGKKNAIPLQDVNDITQAKFESMTVVHSERTRAYVKIQDGCESHCTYCIIPQARGKIRSKPPQDVLAEVKNLISSGYQEIVLTGIETASYGMDFEQYRLEDLLATINALDGNFRIRLGSLDPSMMKPVRMDILAGLDKLAPHFHLSLQSGSDAVLRRMKRKYTTAMVAESMAYLRGKIPYVTFTTDIMTGFPQETEEEFQQTVQFMQQAHFLETHIFPYSLRPDTPAATFSGQISEEIKGQRAAFLAQTQRKCKQEWIEQIVESHPVFPVLFESQGDGYAQGHTPNFLMVLVKSDPLFQHGQLKNIQLTHSDGIKIYGECI